MMNNILFPEMPARRKPSFKKMKNFEVGFYDREGRKRLFDYIEGLRDSNNQFSCEYLKTLSKGISISFKPREIKSHPPHVGYPKGTVVCTKGNYLDSYQRLKLCGTKISNIVFDKKEGLIIRCMEDEANIPVGRYEEKYEGR